MNQIRVCKACKREISFVSHGGLSWYFCNYCYQVEPDTELGLEPILRKLDSINVLTAVSLVAIALATTIALSGCGEATGQFKYAGCTVTQHTDGALISCPDGTTGFISNPEPLPSSTPMSTATPCPTPKPSPTPKHKHGHDRN